MLRFELKFDDVILPLDIRRGGRELTRRLENETHGETIEVTNNAFINQVQQRMIEAVASLRKGNMSLAKFNLQPNI